MGAVSQCSRKGHLSTQAENQLFDNIAGVDVCGSLTNIDTVLGREAAVRRRSCPQRLRRPTCHVVGVI